MSEPAEPLKIVIVGGGTAGWLSAAFLSAQLPQTLNQPVAITLVEASDIATVGVGEATIPTLRQTLAACGIQEAEFLRASEATFKHGIQFIQWRRPIADDPGEAYFHPFGDPIAVNNLNPARQWSKLDVASRGAFEDLFSVQPELAKAGRAPKHLKDRPYDGALPYAYHLDAGKFAQFLKQRFRGQTVHHIIAKVETVKHSDSGDIEQLLLDTGDTLEADLFIDCTGFSSRLINADKTNTFIDKSSVLFIDRAVTVRLPHKGIPDITGFTKCTAQTAGWIWDIALQERRGIGHVYSSRHISDEDAHASLAAYLDVQPERLESRLLPMRIGYQRQQWRGNCIAIGLSSGFLEPLESTGIYLIEMANWALADLIPRYVAGNRPQAHYDAIMRNHYENIVDFLKLHYCLSERRDASFWIDNCDPATIPETLKDKLQSWQETIPSIYDFDRSTQCFSATNYQFILFGMGWKGHVHPRRPDTYTQNMLQELATRRGRLKQFVLRDTLPNADIFSALNSAPNQNRPAG